MVGVCNKTMTVRQILIVDRESRILWTDVMKSVPVVCQEHRGYVGLDGNGHIVCKRGKHIITYSTPIEIVEL